MIDQGAVDQLKTIFKHAVLCGDSGSLKKYSMDTVMDRRYAAEPSAVVFPETTDEVSNLMKWAYRWKTPVTPRGAGSGLSGGAIPAPGGVLCCFEKMNRILEIDTANMMVTLEPGVITNELDKALEPSGLFFAGYPMSEDMCFIGGNLAENAGGGRAIKYGVTANYVIGAQIVGPTGDIMKLGGKRLKDVTGYNLLQLMVGSEGTLGLFTEITLRLVPRPQGRCTLLGSFESDGSAARCISDLKTRLPSTPSSIEFIDAQTVRETMEIIRSARGVPVPEKFAALLLVEFEGDSAEGAKAQRSVAAEILADNQGTPIDFSGDPRESELCWNLRKAVPWYTKRIGGQYISLEDVVVPPASVPLLVEYTEKLRRKYGVKIPLFGHAGDGNFHLTPIKAADMDPDAWYSLLEDLLKNLYGFIGSLGGTISGEHGIGRKRSKYLDTVLDPASIAAMRAVKLALDPENLLNPGVIFNQ